MTQTTFDYEAGPTAPSAGTLNAMVLRWLEAGGWWMPYEICQGLLSDEGIMVSDSGLTARLRDLRKPQYGAHTIEKRIREGSKAYEYRLNDRRAA